MTRGHDLPFDVNCSILFTELPLLERPAAARAAGFGAIELWWPFADAVPGDREPEALVRAVGDAGVRLVGLNFAAGDLAGGHRGLLSWPDRAAEFRDNVEATVGIGERLGCRAFNALYGNRVEGADPAAQDELATEQLALADLYHLASNGDDLDRVAGEHAGRVAHVQIADVPGRGAPGSGTLDLDRHLGRLEAAGYRSWVGLEYVPDGPGADSFGWLPRERRQGGTP